MQAIKTKFLPCTNSTGARIKASCERGSITIPYPYEKSGEYCHVLAIEALLTKFEREDVTRFRIERQRNPKNEEIRWWPNGYHIAQVDNTGYVAVPVFAFNKYGMGAQNEG